MKKLILLIPCMLVGGTEVATLDTAKNLLALGYDVEVLVYFNEVNPIMHAAFTSSGIKVRVLGLTRGSGVLPSIRLTWSLLRGLGFQRHPIIWVQYMTPTLFPLLIARFFSRQLIASVHVAGNHYSSAGKRRLRWLATWWCDRFVCVSKTSMNGIFGDITKHRRLAHRVRVIPNGIDMTAVEAAPRRDWRAELDLRAGTQLVGYVGRLAHNKGVDVMLRAAALLAPKKPNLHWIVVGCGEEIGNLRQLVNEAHIAQRVHFVGALPRDAVYSAIKGFDIAVVPSREEGFGLSALEAMACGVPLVASKVDALSEVVAEGEAGLLFMKGSANSLAKNIQRLIDDLDLCCELSKDSIKHVSRRYGHLIYRTKLQNFISNLK